MTLLGYVAPGQGVREEGVAAATRFGIKGVTKTFFTPVAGRVRG